MNSPLPHLPAHHSLVGAFPLPQKRDPIPQLRDYMLKHGLATEAEIKDLEKSVADEVDDAVDFADKSPKPVRTGSCWGEGCVMWERHGGGGRSWMARQTLQTSLPSQ